MALRDWFRLARVPLAPTAAFDALACALLARGPGLARDGAGALGLVDALLLAATSVLAYTAGMAGNDLADRVRDRTIHPERPIPSGRIHPAAAAAFVVACAALAVALGGGPAGHVAGPLGAVLLAALYNHLAKRRRVPGAIAMGGVRIANSATGVLPLLIAGTTSPLALLGPLLIGIYSAGVTILSTAEDRPGPAGGRLLFARATSFVAYAGAGILSCVGARSLALGLFLAGAACTSLAFGRVPRRNSVRLQVLELLLGLYWLEAMLATGGARGSDWAFALTSLGAAVAGIYLSQIAIRALRPAAPPTP